MQIVRLPATEFTPAIVFDPARSSLEMRGHCQPHRSDQLFNPLTHLLRHHFSERQPQFFTLSLMLDYMDKPTALALRELFVMLDTEGRMGRWIEVIWKCAADDNYQIEMAELLMSELPNIDFHCDPMALQ